MVLAPLHQGRPWIRKDELPGYEQDQDIYTKPGKYLSRPLLSAPRTCAAVVALLASGPSAVLAEVLVIITSHKQMGGHLWGNGGMLGHSSNASKRTWFRKMR